MISPAEVYDQEMERQRYFLSEVFHDLSQPLTALQCSLELSLRRDRTVEELQADVEAALENAERLRQRLLLLRALTEAADPGDGSSITDLNQLLRELQEEMLPLFESAGQILELRIGRAPVQVRADKVRLMRALFYFLEYLFRYSAAGAVVRLKLENRNSHQAEINICAQSCLPVSPSVDDREAPQISCEVEIVRRSFRAAGGGFELISHSTDHSVWRAGLPTI